MINNTTAARIPKFMPFQEAVTFFSRTKEDTFTSTSVGLAHRKKVNKDEKDFPPEILAMGDLVWSIYVGYLPTEPAIDDYLMDNSGISWTVIHVTENMNAQIWEIMTRKQV